MIETVTKSPNMLLAFTHHWYFNSDKTYSIFHIYKKRFRIDDLINPFIVNNCSISVDKPQLYIKKIKNPFPGTKRFVRDCTFFGNSDVCFFFNHF